MILMLATLVLTLSEIESPLFHHLDEKEFPFIDFSNEWKMTGEGRQMVVCTSNHFPYVIKFFKRSSIESPWYFKLPFMERILKYKKRRIERRKKFFEQGYLLAQKYFSEETGILFFHSGIAQSPLPKIHLKTNLLPLNVDLNCVPFVLQKRADISFLNALKNSGSSSNFQMLIDQFLSFIEKRISLYIADFDRNIESNYCLLNGKLLYIDPACFYYDPILNKKEEWWKATHRLRKWIEQYAKDELEAFDQKLQQKSGR